MVRKALIALSLFLSACDSEPNSVEANAQVADQDAQQALSEIGQITDQLNNVENKQNDIQGDIDELDMLTTNHDEQLKSVTQKADQSEADISEIKDRLRM